LGLNVEVIGVEGDEAHIGFAIEACKVNGLSGEQVRLIHGIAAATDGIALFPRQNIGGHNYGLEPLFGASEEDQERAVKSRKYDRLEMVSLGRVIGKDKKLDLLHVDIQGGEADLLGSCIEVLCQQVAYVVVGTHSREIEGKIFGVMRSAGWRIEIERPAILTLNSAGPSVMVDGVQGWRNMQLLRD
jgi:hypothetical protein